MYQTSKRAYRGVKSFINAANLVIAAIVLICVILSIFRVGKELIFLPVIFYMGTIMNILSGIKCLLEGRKLSGVAVLILAALMSVVAVYATLVYWI